jgi:hypothetical protein
MSLRSLSKLIVSLSLLACTSVFAAPLTINVAGIESHGEIGDAANSVFLFNVGANARITTFSWQVNVEAIDPSYLSELGLSITDSSEANGITFAPGSGAAEPGTLDSEGFADLVDLNLAFAVGADGILRLEFFEIFDDFPGADGLWNFGTITFGVEGAPPVGDVPEPATGLLLGAGLALLGYSRRRAVRK